MLNRFVKIIWRGLRPCLEPIFGAIPKRLLTVLLYFIARPLNIQSVIADGKMGPMRGAARDTDVLGEYLRTGDYAPVMMARLKTLLADGSTFIDIGANIGLTSKPLLAMGVECICFEPDPENYRYLSENLAGHVAGGNATLHNLGVYDRSDKLAFERSVWNYGDHRVRAGSADDGEYSEASREVIEVDCVRLDDMLKAGDLRRPLAIKVDTQGSEVNVLDGGRELLAAADLLIFEFWPYGIRRQERSENSLIEFAKASFPMGGRGGKALGPVAGVVGEMKATAQTQGTAHIDVYLAK